MKSSLPIAACLLASACGGSKAPEPAAKTETAKPVAYFHVDPATAGKIHGKILYRGPKPVRKAISMESDAKCEQMHAGKPAYEDTIVTGDGGGLANAFVYIQSGLEGKTFEPPKEAVVIDQRGCTFVPRTVGLRAAQPLELKNDDPVGHNIHPIPKNNREWNEEQPPGSPPATHKFARTEVMIPVKCNIHQWMHAYIGVVEHPYFAVTGPDGSFDFTNVPPGDYTIAVWHEKLGDQSKQAHLAASGDQAVDFTYR